MRAHTTRCRLARRRPGGFTLIEVMIVVAIIGILAAVALPSYSDYIRRGRLPEAFTQLSNYRVTMEQYYQDNRNYGPAGNNCANGRIVSNPPGLNYFSFSCTASGTTFQSYTLTATSTSALGSSHVYTVNQDGTKGTTTFKGATQTGKACWLVRGGEC